MIFAILMLAGALAATLLVGIITGGAWGGLGAALGVAAILVAARRAMTHESAPTRPMRRDQLNAFQRPLADD